MRDVICFLNKWTKFRNACVGSWHGSGSFSHCDDQTCSYRWYFSIQQIITHIRSVVYVELFAWEDQALALGKILITSSPLSSTRCARFEYVNVNPRCHVQLGGAVEACGAHINMRHPKVDGSKPSWATFFESPRHESSWHAAYNDHQIPLFWWIEISLNYLLYSYTWMNEWYLWCLYARVFIVAKR